MVEIHCFITLRDNYNPYCDSYNEYVIPLVQKELDKISDYGIEIKAKNGEYYVEFSTFTNHLGTDFKELFGFFKNVGKVTNGSYGLFYMHDDEDKTDYNNFQVWRLAKGQVKKFKDTLLSPYVPVVEDIYEELSLYLERYTKYNNGDESCKCKLLVEDTTIDNLDFSPYDLGGGAFLGVNFNVCTFKKVYLSNSNFGGSSFYECLFHNNTLRKSEWNNITSNLCTIYELDTFRTEFMESTFVYNNICDSKIIKCYFDDSKFQYTAFVNCEFENVSFKNCKFGNTTFENCSFKDTEFDEELIGVQFENCKKL